jgi:O-antigen/teichoic acid export membrane protein
MRPDASHGAILRSTAIVGAANLLTIVMGIIRTKVLAALLGPSGVGLVGMLTSLMSTASMLAGLGLSGSAVRQLAASSDDAVGLARVRRALWIATLALGSAGGLAVWTLRVELAVATLGDPAQASAIGWVAAGVFLSVVAGSQTALLKGLRRIGDMARATVIGAAAGSIAGIVSVLVWGADGVVAFVLAPPATAVLAAGYFARRLPSSPPAPLRLDVLTTEWRGLIGLGLAFMFIGLLSSIAHLWVRSTLVHELGLDAAGQFQAAWAIASHYVGIVLGAMVADFYPRLVQANPRPSEANNLVNDQIEVGLLLAGPALVLMIGLGPLLVHALYSHQFGEAVALLRWQLAGDLFKLASWPIGLVLVARGNKGAFLFTQSMWVVLYLGLIHAWLPRVGLQITGIAFLACFAVGFLVNFAVVSRLYGFRLSGRNIRTLAGLLAAAAVVLVGSQVSEILAVIAGAGLAIVAGLLSLRELLRLLPARGRAHRFLSRIASMLPGVRHAD